MSAISTPSRVINIFNDMHSQLGLKPKPPTKPRPDGPTPVTNGLHEPKLAYVASRKPKLTTKPRPDGLTHATNGIQQHAAKPKPPTKPRPDGPTPVTT